QNETNICNRYETFQDTNNIEISGGTLKMWISKRTTPITYSFTNDCTTWQTENYTPPHTRDRIYDSEWLITNGVGNPWKYEMNYGYYEMKFKVPSPARDANGNSLSRGIGFGWWTYMDGQNIAGNDPIEFAELDFIELNGLDQTFTHQYLYKIDSTKYFWLNELNFRKVLQDIPGNPSLEEYADFRQEEDPFHSPDEDGFHVMSCEVTPQKITWYMDGKYLQSTTGDLETIATLENLPHWNMELGIATVPGQNADLNDALEDKPDYHTVFPYTVEIDYVRYHRFTCGAGQSRIEQPALGINFPFADLEARVYDDIAVGEPIGGGPRVTSSDNVSLRAANGVELLPGFEVELGGELYADAHECGN
ncbi:MAG: hypothetical protein ACI80H_001538, partial [Pseudoalteromonas distincta]